MLPCPNKLFDGRNMNYIYDLYNKREAFAMTGTARHSLQVAIIVWQDYHTALCMLTLSFVLLSVTC